MLGKVDVLVIGGGLAGFAAATQLRDTYKVCLVSRSVSTGPRGVTLAAARQRLLEPTDAHLAATLSAGSMLNYPEVVSRISHEREAVAAWLSQTVGASMQDSRFHYSAGLVLAELIVADGRCFGARFLRVGSDELVEIGASAVVLATGGAGQLYVPGLASGFKGGGLIAAWVAGAALSNMEFVHFNQGNTPFMCGGLAVDEHSGTSIEGLYAVGEVACTGFHGAGLLPGNEIVEAISASLAAARHIEQTLIQSGTQIGQSYPWSEASKDLVATYEMVAQWVSIRMVEACGAHRDEVGLRHLAVELAQVIKSLYPKGRCFSKSIAAQDTYAALKAAWVICESALTRNESLGCHTRQDYPAEALQKIPSFSLSKSGL